MLPAVLALVTLQATLEAPKAVMLPNGAQVIAQAMPGARSLCVQLVWSARYTPDTPETHGWRHLLEHLVTQGPKGDLDARLERRGMFLNAETTRDLMRFTIDAPPGDLAFAIEALGELLRPFGTTAEAISGEVKVHEQERTLLPPEIRLSGQAWQAAFDGARLDPFGDPSAMRDASPDDLADLHWLLTQPENVALVIAGPTRPDDAVKQGRSLLERLPKGPGGLRPPADPPSKSADVRGDHPGTLRAAVVPGLPAHQTVATYALALALRAKHPSIRAVYAPTTRPGLISLWHADGRELDRIVTELGEAGAAEIVSMAKLFGSLWADALDEDVTEVANWRGLEAALGAQGLLERTAQRARELDDTTLRAALASFSDAKAVVVRGSR